MNAEDFIVYNGCNWKTIKTLDKLFPKFERISSLALVIEAVDTVNRATFMVASQKEKVFWILDLVG